MIEKYTPPTSLDEMPYGQLWKVLVEPEPEYWIQISNRTGEVEWVRIGIFFEKIFAEDFVCSPDFMNDCMNLFDQYKNKKLMKIIEEHRN